MFMFCLCQDSTETESIGESGGGGGAEKERETNFKELAYAVVRTGKSEMSRPGQQAGNEDSGRVGFLFSSFLFVLN